MFIHVAACILLNPWAVVKLYDAAESQVIYNVYGSLHSDCYMGIFKLRAITY